jgi:Fe-S-cluster-containing dehydrogenase component
VAVSGISRRDFIKRAVASSVTGGMVVTGAGKLAHAHIKEPWGSFIDLTKCDGCPGLSVPACVSACRKENSSKFPQPAEEIENYWPRNTKEDWSDKKDLTTRLTPYNWLFVQKVTVNHNGKKVQVFVPRRCMHCDNPPCANLCPFGAQYKTPEGPVLINKDLCLGGRKCRQVCPWGIPARQAGVGLYMKIAPKYLGAGVMYKCDLCYHRLKDGRSPACMEACPQKAMAVGSKETMRKMALKRAREIGGFTYGINENGGTSTFYVSPVPFEKIHQVLVEQKSKQTNPSTPGFPGMPVNAGNILDTANGMVTGVLIAPVAGAVAAGYAAYRTMKGGDEGGK